VTKRIDKPTETPTVLFSNPGLLSGTRVDRALKYRIGIMDDKQSPTRRSVDRVRAEAAVVRRRGRDPKDCIVYRELRDDVVAVPDAMHDDSSKRRRVELDRSAGALRPIAPVGFPSRSRRYPPGARVRLMRRLDMCLTASPALPLLASALAEQQAGDTLDDSWMEESKLAGSLIGFGSVSIGPPRSAGSQHAPITPLL
jgi:hypothetical protein